MTFGVPVVLYTIGCSDWEGTLGDHNFDCIPNEAPNVMARMSTNLDPLRYDLSGMGLGDDAVGNEVNINFCPHRLMSSVSRFDLHPHKNCREGKMYCLHRQAANMRLCYFFD